MRILFNKIGLRVLLILVSGVVSIWSPCSISAQTHYSANVSLGVKAGADLSRVFFSPSVDQVFKPGAMAGLTFRYIEESHFGLIAELNFVQRGWKESFEDTPYSYSRTMDYLQIPILAHIYFGRRGRFFINLGPEFGVRLSDKISSNFDTETTASLPDFPKYHSIRQYSEPVKQRVDYGIAAGLGGEFSLNRKNAINLEVRFYYGLGNIFSASKKDYFKASNSMSLQFCLGYLFRVK